MNRQAGAILIAALAFLLYRATLLPGVDFGDTPSFQVMAGRPVVSPRDAYPLYFSIGRVFVWTIGGDPAHALNMASAVEGAVACGLIVLVAAELSGSIAAAMAATWLFASSYTFWSQAVIAEVYALHILFVALTLLLILWWDRQPTTPRLACVFLVYAVGFGNHLSMILLAPALSIFLVARRDWRSLLTGRTLVLATACATAGAAQYVWNLHALWLEPLPPHNLLEGLQTFWFDVTKSDWRTTMVLSVPASMLAERLRMYAFDVHQQFGWLGPILAVAGVAHLLRTAASRATLLLATYAVTLAFALSYSVGDSHVFFLPSHLVIALLAAPGVVWLGRIIASAVAVVRGFRPAVAVVAQGFSPAVCVVVVAAVVAIVATIRTYADYPAMDRSGDHRPTQWLETLTTGLEDGHAVLLSDLNWQSDNGLTYFARRTQKSLTVARMPAVVLYAPALIHDNRSIGRPVVLTEQAASTLEAAYGPLFATAPDASLPPATLTNVTLSVPRGTRYALCLLRPTPDTRLNESDLRTSLEYLTGHRVGVLPSGDYAVVAGTVGDQPSLVRSADRPFHVEIAVDGVPVTVRMESWLAFDTIRRMGFGHVIAARRHTLIVERGVSFVAFDAAGEPLRVGYAAGLFAPQTRYIVTDSP